MNRSENELTENTRRAEGMLAHEYGEFVLFGLFQREETAGKWDVLVSAPWLTNDRAGIQQIVDGLRSYLTAENWMKIGGIAPLPPDSDFVRTVARIFGVEHQVWESGSFEAEGIRIDRAFLITAGKNREPVAGQHPVTGSYLAAA